MIEILAVLAIVAVLTVISVVTAQVLFHKYKATQITKAVEFAEQEIAHLINTNQPVGTQQLDTQAFGWNNILFDDCFDGSIDVVISGIPQKVCQSFVATWMGRQDISLNVMPYLNTSLIGLTCQKNIEEYETQCQAEKNEVVLTFYVNNIASPQATPEPTTETLCQTDTDCAISGCTDDCEICCRGKCTHSCAQCNGHGEPDSTGNCICDTGYSGKTCECNGTVCGSLCCESGKKCSFKNGAYQCINTATSCTDFEIVYNDKCCPKVEPGNACSYIHEANDCPVVTNRCKNTDTCITGRSTDCSANQDCCQSCNDNTAFASTLEECDVCPNRFWANGICYACNDPNNIEHTSAQQCNKCWVRFFTGRNLLDGICYRNTNEICGEYESLDNMTQEQCRDCHRIWGKVDKTEKCFNCLDNFFIWTTKADCNLCPKRFYTQGRCYPSFEQACSLSSFPSTEGQCHACGEGRRFWVNGVCYPCSRQKDIPSTKEQCDACGERRIYENGFCKLNN